ncbi:MAG: redox-sensing transcriptional repressor Rex [Thermodesulfobacteriota bacterium]
MKYIKIPPATINRLSIYSRKLGVLIQEGLDVVSSEKLANECGVNSAQLRKDLAYFGEFGVRGVGYYTETLLQHIKKILGLEKEWRLGLFGVGNLGQALLHYPNFVKQGYRFVAAFDVDPAKIGQTIGSGLPISHVKDVAEVINREPFEIGVITTPADQAKRVADLAIRAGVKGLLNFAPVILQVPGNIIVEHVDFTIKLDCISYYLTTRG